MQCSIARGRSSLSKHEKAKSKLFSDERGESYATPQNIIEDEKRSNLGYVFPYVEEHYSPYICAPNIRRKKYKNSNKEGNQWMHTDLDGLFKIQQRGQRKIFLSNTYQENKLEASQSKVLLKIFLRTSRISVGFSVIPSC